MVLLKALVSALAAMRACECPPDWECHPDIAAMRAWKCPPDIAAMRAGERPADIEAMRAGECPPDIEGMRAHGCPPSRLYSEGQRWTECAAR